MTTTVLIGTHGNKVVRVDAPQGAYLLPPGQWMELSIHDGQSLKISETGAFVASTPGVTFLAREVSPQGDGGAG